MESDFFHKIHAYTTAPLNLKPKQMTEMSHSRANQHREPIRVSSDLTPSWARLEGAHPWKLKKHQSSSLLDRMAEGGRWWVGDWSEKQELSGLDVQKQDRVLLAFFPSFFAVKDLKFLPYRSPQGAKPGLPTDQTQQWSSELLSLHNSAVLVRRESRVPSGHQVEVGGAGPG